MLSVRSRVSLIASGLLLLTYLMFSYGPTTALAAKSEGCLIQGSWIGYHGSSAYWVSTASGQNAASGTYELEVPGYLNQLPGAVRASAMRGNWERTGDYSFRVTTVGIAVDSTGSTLYIVKVSGDDTLSEDCNSMSINSSIEVFWGDQDPFEDDPFLVVPPVPHMGYRMSIDPLPTE